jgi:hypothetical protein
MSPDKEREYAELISFVSIFAAQVFKIDPTDPVHPANVAAHIASTVGKSQALVGAGRGKPPMTRLSRFKACLNSS